MKSIIYQRIYIVNKEELDIWNSNKDYVPCKFKFEMDIKMIIDDPRFVPHEGAEIESSLWHRDDNPQKVIDVYRDRENYFVKLPHYCFYEDTSFGKEFEKCINGHGWTL